MNKTILFALCIASFFSLFAQKNANDGMVEIGKAADGKYTITADTSSLFKAIKQTVNDGTLFTEMHIESVNKYHYLVAKGLQKNYSKTIAIELIYNINNRTFYAVNGLAHKTCAAAGCSICEPFKENGNIIGCHCKALGTVSNECNFKTEPKSSFYTHLIRYLKIKSDK